MEGRQGQGATLFACLLLLAGFQFSRTVAEWTAPPRTALDCDLIAAADVPAMERCLTTRPDDVELMADLGGAYERAGRWDRAQAVYEQALASDADDGDMRVRLGFVLLQRGDRDGARREASAASLMQPGRSAPLDLMRQAGGDSPERGHR